MSILVAMILGFIEGATEFLPVSSSGHLIIARQIFGINTAGGLSFDAILQLATSLALLVYFWKDIAQLVASFFKWISGRYAEEKDKTLIKILIIGTIPAVVFGLLLESKMDTVFRNINLVAITLVLGSILFWFAEKYGKQDKTLTLGRGVVVGFFQCLALVPGVSRSGATISGGLFSGLKKDEAVRFSFLLSIPILFGSGLKKLFEVRGELLSGSFGLPLLFGSLVAFITGLLAISFLIRYLKSHSLNVFIIYRILLAIFILFI